MGWIILLIIIGLILFFAELVLLPGITLAAIGAFCCLVAAASWAFVEYGMMVGFIVTGVILVCIALETIFFLRPKTWKKAALNATLNSTIMTPIVELIPVGTDGITLTRLAPMGTVTINGKNYEAKSLDSFIDPKTPVVVRDYDNQTLVVERIENN